MLGGVTTAPLLLRPLSTEVQQKSPTDDLSCPCCLHNGSQLLGQLLLRSTDLDTDRPREALPPPPDFLQGGHFKVATGFPGAGDEPQVCHHDDVWIMTLPMTQPLRFYIQGALVKFLGVADMGSPSYPIFQIFNLESIGYFL